VQCPNSSLCLSHLFPHIIVLQGHVKQHTEQKRSTDSMHNEALIHVLPYGGVSEFSTDVGNAAHGVRYSRDEN